MKAIFFYHCVLLSCLFFCSQGFAIPAPPPDQKPSRANRAHEAIGDSLVILSDSIDAFFGEKRALDKKNTSSLVLSQSQDVPEGGIPQSRTNLSLNLRLINFESMGQRAGMSFLGIAEESKDADGSSEQDESVQAQKNPWRASLDQQLTGTFPPGYLARLRITKDWEPSVFLHHFQYEFGYDTVNIWSTRVSLVSDFQAQARLLLRWSNELEWLIDRFVASSSHGPSAIHTVGTRTFMSYNLRYNTTLFDRVLFVSSYVASLTLRRDLYEGWVFFNIEPSLTFPRQKDYKQVWNLAFRLEALFGGN